MMIDRAGLKKLAEENSSVTAARDGNFTLTSGGKTFHSSYSPAQEAARLTAGTDGLDRDATFLVFLGAGLGYTVEEMEKKGFPNAVVIELDPAAWKYFDTIYKLPDGYRLLGPGGSPEDLDAILSGVNLASVRSFKTIVLRGAYSPETYGPYEERIERLMKVKLGDLATRMNFEELWTVNILGNISGLARSSPVSTLFGSAKGQPVMIVSAGPSLSASLTDIRQAAPYCVTVAADTALLPLTESGVIPDFVYSLDSQIHNLGDFSMIPRSVLNRTRLVHDLVVHPSLPALFHRCGAGVYAANTAHLDSDPEGRPRLVKSELVSFIEKSGGFAVGDIESGGSVSTSAFHFAWLLGGDPVILVGQDLSYVSRTTHAPSTSHFYRALRRTSRLLTLPTVFQNVIRSRRTLPVPDVSGSGSVTTDFVLNNYRQWLEESVRNAGSGTPGARFLNATVSGARISGFRSVSLSDWTRGRDTPAQKRFPVHLINSSGVDKIRESLNRLSETLRELPRDSGLWDILGRSEWPFLERYFLREKTFFERYGRSDTGAIERKVRRLSKDLNRLVYGH